MRGALARELGAAYRGRRVLVTGETGFKGGWLAAWLLDLGAEVHGFALPPEADQPLFGQLGLARRLGHRDGDVRDSGALARAFAEARPEVVFHLAAQSLVLRGYAEPRATFETNVGGAVNLLEAARRSPGLKALVFVTSDKCYLNRETGAAYREDDPLGGRDPYGASKAAAEMVFAAYRASFFAGADAPGLASARAGNVIGGGDMAADRILPDCVRAFRTGAPVRLRRPRARRPWQHVLDPLAGYLVLGARLMAGANAGGAWNFGPEPGSARSVAELARAFAAAWGRDPDSSVIEAPEAGAPHEATLLSLDSAKARSRLGWRPRWGFDEAVRRAARWYKTVDGGADPAAATAAEIHDYMRESDD
ncbi:MAG: CDP-glucose 4,6-dehydratase [Proteobacteria bacterium]|nr:CDP-glucose 4,6-dehydratase [Pseudomonadota bacterium]